jgi:hypothetical protein
VTKAFEELFNTKDVTFRRPIWGFKVMCEGDRFVFTLYIDPLLEELLDFDESKIGRPPPFDYEDENGERHHIPVVTQVERKEMPVLGTIQLSRVNLRGQTK